MQRLVGLNDFKYLLSTFFEGNDKSRFHRITCALEGNLARNPVYLAACNSVDNGLTVFVTSCLRRIGRLNLCKSGKEKHRCVVTECAEVRRNFAILSLICVDECFDLVVCVFNNEGGIVEATFKIFIGCILIFAVDHVGPTVSSEERNLAPELARLREDLTSVLVVVGAEYGVWIGTHDGGELGVKVYVAFSKRLLSSNINAELFALSNIHFVDAGFVVST